MKFKFLLIACFACALLSTRLSAQIPNPDFETWAVDTMATSSSSFTYNRPTGWFPLFSAFYWGGATGNGPLSCYKSTDKNSGSYALELRVESDSVGADMLAAFPQGYRPLQLNGYYKYTGAPSDSFVIYVGIYKGNSVGAIFGDTTVIEIGTGVKYFSGGSATSYAPFSIPIYYNAVPDVPDSALIMIVPLNGAGGLNPGQKFYVDGLAFFGVSAIDEELMKNQISIFPNPAHNRLNIGFQTSFRQAQVEIMDISGRSLYNEKLNMSSNSVDLSSFDPGIYLLRLTKDGKTFTKKIMKN